MTRTIPTLALTALLAVVAACGGDPNPQPDASRDASGMVVDVDFDALLSDLPLVDGQRLPDGFIEELLASDVLPPDASVPTDATGPADGAVSGYICASPREVQRVAQPSTMVSAGPLGTMTIFQAPPTVTRRGQRVYYVGRDATGWGIRRVDASGAGDTVVLRTDAPATHVAEVGPRVLFRPAGDAASLESVNLDGGDRRVEFRNVVIPDGAQERTRPFGDATRRFVFAVRTTDGVRGDRFLLLRRRGDGAEEVIFSRRFGAGSSFMPPIAVIHDAAVIATTRSDASAEGGLLFVPLERAAIADPTAMQDDSALRFVPYTTLFGPSSSPGGTCVGSCVQLAALPGRLFCVRQSGCAGDLAPTLRRYDLPTLDDLSPLSVAGAQNYDLAARVGARGPASIGRIAAAPDGQRLYVLMNLPSPGPGRARHDLLEVMPDSTALRGLACDLPLVFGFAPNALSISGANERDEWWGVWTWGTP